MRILIVEDEAIIAEDLREILINMGHEAQWVMSAEGAISWAKKCWPDVILMDVNLHRKGDGVLAAEEIMTFSKVPIIFVTSLPLRDMFEDLHYGRCAYLSKPVTRNQLAAAIQQTTYREIVPSSPNRDLPVAW